MGASATPVTVIFRLALAESAVEPFSLSLEVATTPSVMVPEKSFGGVSRRSASCSGVSVQVVLPSDWVLTTAPALRLAPSGTPLMVIWLMDSDPSVSVRVGLMERATEVSSVVRVVAAVTLGASATASTMMVPVAVCSRRLAPDPLPSTVPTFSV